MNKQLRNFISPQRPNQTTGALIHYLVKASVDLNMGNCVLERQFFAYCFDKKGLGSQDIQHWSKKFQHRQP
jgi:hypothetical protein